MDGGFGQSTFQEERLEEQLRGVFKENMKNSYGRVGKNAVSLEEPIFTFLIDGDWDFFLREITLNRMEGAVSTGIEYIMEPVSYTHLFVERRQRICRALAGD